MMALLHPLKASGNAAEMWCYLTLQHGTAYTVVAAQIDLHEKQHGEKPSMVLVIPSLWRPLVLQVAKAEGIDPAQLVLGPIAIYGVPIIFSQLQDASAYVQVHGSKPSQVWSF